MKKYIPSVFLTLSLGASLAIAGCSSSADPVDLADPMVGTGFHGHTFPGATTPFGAVQLSPDTRMLNWDACSGYHYSDSTLDGFSHTHLSGTGCCDLGDVLVRPLTRKPDTSGGTPLYSPASFSHSDENAKPGYYSVRLKDDNILAELTATPHTGVHRYTFPKDGEAVIVIDLDHNLSGEEVAEASITVTGDSTLTGTRITNGWVADHHVDFSAKFSKPIKGSEIVNNGHAAVLIFENDGAPLEMAVGISGISEQNATANLQAEVPLLDFDLIATQANERWAEALGKITVEGGTAEQKRNFYSALYHTMIAPNLMSDVNGEFRAHDGSVKTMPDNGNYYSTFSLWDTYRSLNPLLTILYPELVCDMVNSMLEMYDASGELPIWPLASGETGCMIGYHSVSAIADAYLKGFRCFDPHHALEAMVASSNKPRKATDVWGSEGYIPCDRYKESVSCSLENSYDDWCIARLAEAIGNDSITSIYYERAGNYANLFDTSTNFFRGHKADGNWTAPFIPAAVSGDYTEATAWQYRFAPVHDVRGLINLFGGTEAFTEALDSLFTVSSELVGEQSDITGMIGQYAHGNEPSHHVAYLYNFVGQPWKTQEMTRRILDEMYQPTPEGICGNEDCGQMSAWYVFTALGLYPVAPGSNQLAITTPLFEKATVELPAGKTLVITANNPGKNRFIESVEFNGKKIDNNFIEYSELQNGGELNFQLTDKPVTTRGTDPEASLYSMTEIETVSTPFCPQNLELFTDSVIIELGVNTEGAEIRYTTDGSEPTKNSPLYEKPFMLDRSVPIRARAYKEGYSDSREMKVQANKTEYLQPLKLQPVKNGVRYEYYEGNCEKTADIARAKLVRKGVIPAPSIDSADQEDHFAFIFSGYIDVPETGIYEFSTKSDDGSVLFVGGKPVVFNDGGHSAQTSRGKIVLAKGIHSFRLLYFEDYEGEELSWDWKVPGASDYSPIPEKSLYAE